MLDLTALMNGLPRIGLEPFDIAYIDHVNDGAHSPRVLRGIRLIEPPAGLCVPCLEPEPALAALLCGAGHAAGEAIDLARESIARMAAEWPDVQWVHALNVWDPDAPVQVPVPKFLGWLRWERQRVGREADLFGSDAADYARRAFEAGLIPLRVLDQLERLSNFVAHAPIFWDPVRRQMGCTLSQLPSLPTPASMIEMFVDVPWANIDNGEDEHVDDAPFGRWREALRPVAQRLEAALGQPVYEFGAKDDEAHDEFDDACHRFLFLHWCCTRMPESSFVRHLMSLAGAPHVESLKAALVAPENYGHPFDLRSVGDREQPRPLSFRFRTEPARKRITLVFLTPYARATADAVLRRHSGAEVLLIAPQALTPEDWVAGATFDCEDVILQYFVSPVYDGALEVLSLTDALYVIADSTPPADGSDLRLSEGIEDLLGLAYLNGVETTYLTGDGLQALDPRPVLEQRGVFAHLAKERAAAREDMHALPELRLDNDFGSTGLWNERGQCLPYSCLDLPFPLVRRIAAWQRDYDQTMEPPHDMGDPAWWDAHEREAVDIARALQGAVGPGTVVKVWVGEGWRAIDEVGP